MKYDEGINDSLTSDRLATQMQSFSAIIHKIIILCVYQTSSSRR